MIRNDNPCNIIKKEEYEKKKENEMKRRKVNELINKANELLTN